MAFLAARTFEIEAVACQFTEGRGARSKLNAAFHNGIQN